MKTRPCLIIGASGDIGAAIAHRLLEQGRKVALTHSPRSGPRASLADLERDKGKWYSVDVKDAKAVADMIAAVEADFGAVPDLVYSAGITNDGSISLITDEMWDGAMATNLSGAFYCVRALSRSLMAAGNGRIVFIGSLTGSKGNSGQLAYAATKGGLEAMCRVIALEMGRFGTTCNVVAPGPVEGKMIGNLPSGPVEQFRKKTPMRRFGEPDEVAALTCFLLGEESQYITGQTIRIDGGLSA